MTTTKTKILGTITKHAYKIEPTVITKTKTKTCSIPRKQNHRDPWCTITPTVAYAAALETASATPTPAASATGKPRRRRDAINYSAQDRAEFLAARSARLAAAGGIEKRGLDVETVEVTETDTAKFKTSTTWTTGPAVTMTITQESTQSTTTTSTSTSFKGVTQVVKTITAVSPIICVSRGVLLTPASQSTPTKTKTKYDIVKITSTITRRPTVTRTTKWAPASSTAICKAKGGKLV